MWLAKSRLQSGEKVRKSYEITSFSNLFLAFLGSNSYPARAIREAFSVCCISSIDADMFLFNHRSHIGEIKFLTAFRADIGLVGIIVMQRNNCFATLRAFKLFYIPFRKEGRSN